MSEFGTTPCSICTKPTSFMRENCGQPKEGEYCRSCEAWVCTDCVDWELMSDFKTCEIYCLKCGRSKRTT